MYMHKILTKRKTRTIITSVFILLLITIGLNYIMRQHLYNSSIVTIIKIQRNETPTSNIFFNFMIILADARLVGLIFVVSNLICKDKNYVLSLLIYFLGCTWLSIILKLLYADSRPFWSSSAVKNLADQCLFDYGNPFGSAITPILLFEPIIVQFLGLGKYYLHLLIPGVFAVLIPFAGLYLGIASINQILFGIILNLCALLLFKLYFAQLFLKFLKEVNNYTEMGKIMMLQMSFFHIFVIFFPLAVFLNRPHAQLERAILINLGISCEVVPSSLKDINFQMLILSAFINICFGYCYGYYMDGKTGRRNTKRWSLPDGFWWLKFLIDCILLLLPAFIITYIH